MQIRGGRGYETADSLKARGEEPIAVERFMRDCRINTIFEGSSEIMRLFIAREALDPHLKVAGAALNTQLPLAERAKAALKAGLHYAAWYPQQWLPLPGLNTLDTSGAPSLDPRLKRHLRYAARTSRKLARTLFHAMALHGPKLERQQILLGRFVDIGTELFAMSATCCRAQTLFDTGEHREDLIPLADFFCRTARERITALFASIHHNSDTTGYRLAQEVSAGKLTWLESGILSQPHP